MIIMICIDSVLESYGHTFTLYLIVSPTHKTPITLLNCSSLYNAPYIYIYK